jgi:hypothetical protein
MLPWRYLHNRNRKLLMRAEISLLIVHLRREESLRILYPNQNSSGDPSFIHSGIPGEEGSVSLHEGDHANRSWSIRSGPMAFCRAASCKLYQRWCTKSVWLNVSGTQCRLHGARLLRWVSCHREPWFVVEDFEIPIRGPWLISLCIWGMSWQSSLAPISRIRSPVCP